MMGPHCLFLHISVICLFLANILHELEKTLNPESGCFFPPLVGYVSSGPEFPALFGSWGNLNWLCCGRSVTFLSHSQQVLPLSAEITPETTAHEDSSYMLFTLKQLSKCAIHQRHSWLQVCSWKPIFDTSDVTTASRNGPVSGARSEQRAL